ncbi:hypothetical protein BDV41DRAFT_89192 [Aspergillus transmontanensis]|uniref:Uncharacterized protein n=1 Tax=Aspergillus transmontanensis TaxID=1034304 RepID=A0A5N6VFF6_9EURO|nr:hypothetical protein BDV41DRAFT_89192 [Aspergillus transmontanensis]
MMIKLKKGPHHHTSNQIQSSRQAPSPKKREIRSTDSTHIVLNRPGGGENPQLWGWLNENRPDQVWRAAEPPQRSKTVGLDLVGRDNTVPNTLELIVMDLALLLRTYYSASPS